MSRLEEATTEFLAALEARKDEALSAVEQADKEGDEMHRKIEALRQEREALSRTIKSLEDERERLPVESYRRGLDEEYEEEDRLKARYKVAGEELHTARARAAEVEDELSRLMPRRRGHDLDATIAAYSGVAKAASGYRSELEAVRERTTKALEENVQPVIDSHETAKGRNAAWNSRAEWEEAERRRWGKTVAESAAEIEERERLRAKSG